MKKVLTVLALLCAAHSSSAQLVNASFENWITDSTGTTRLVDWRHESSTGAANPFLIGTYRDTSSQHGLYALKLSRWYNYTWDQASQTRPVNYRPQVLSGHYTYVDNELTAPTLLDTAEVRVFLTAWNATAGHRDTVGMGVRELGQTHTYTHFQCLISYTSPQLPDSITVLIKPTKWWYGSGSGICPNAGWCSFLTIDNLSLYGVASAPEQQKPHRLALFPNPARTHLTLQPAETAAGEAALITVSDVQGRTLLQQTWAGGGSAAQLDIRKLPVGLYVVKLTSDKAVWVNRLVVEE